MEAYTLVRSKRKTLSVSLDKNGAVIVRAPLRLPLYRIEEFVEKSQPWIERRRKEMEIRIQKRRVITEKERSEGIEAAKSIFPSACLIMLPAWV